MTVRAEMQASIAQSFSLAERAGTVLVVDDSSTMRTVVRRILQRLEVDDVVEAPDAASAFQLLHEQSFGVVICDLQMEPHDGFHLLRGLRDMPEERAETPFILMTASLDAKNVEVARYRGADAYVLKPFSPEALRQKLEAVLPMGRFVAQSQAAMIEQQVIERRVKTFTGSR
jgi:two-component system, chemotaxis family, chemotaxis protein CheY